MINIDGKHYKNIIIHGFTGSGKSDLASRIKKRCPELIIVDEFDLTTNREEFVNSILISQLLQDFSSELIGHAYVFHLRGKDNLDYYSSLISASPKQTCVCEIFSLWRNGCVCGYLQKSTKTAIS